MNLVDFDNVLNDFKKKPNIKKINTDNIINSLEIYKKNNKLNKHTNNSAKNKENHLKEKNTNIKKSQSTNYNYLINNIIDMSMPKLKSNENTIYLCIYGIIYIKSKPIVLYFSEKDNNIIDFVHFKTNNDSFKKKLNNELSNIQDILKKETFFKGYKTFNNNYYLFYEMPIINITNLCNSNKNYFITISEIVNLKKVYNYNIADHIINLFTSNTDLCILMKDETICETPTIMYHKFFDNNSLNVIASNLITKGHEVYSPHIYYYFYPVTKIKEDHMLRCIFFIENLYVINDYKIINNNDFINIQKKYDTVLLTNKTEHIFIKFDRNAIEELDNSL